MPPDLAVKRSRREAGIRLCERSVNFDSALRGNRANLQFGRANPSFSCVVLGMHLAYGEADPVAFLPCPAWLLSGRLRAGLAPRPHPGRRELSALFLILDFSPFPFSLQLVSPFASFRVNPPTNLRMLPRSLSMPQAYLRTIEPTAPILLVSLQIERAYCR